MDQIHWPQPAYFPHPGIPYSVPNATYGATPGPSTVLAPPPVPQAPGLSACAQKRFAQDLGQTQIKRAKTTSGGMRNDPSFRPMLDEHGLHNGKFMCTKDRAVLYPESYLKHLRTTKHLGVKLEKFKCPGCPKVYARRDAWKRHFDNSKCEKAVAGGPPPSFSPGPASASSDVVAPVMAPTMAFTFSYPYPTPAMPVPQQVQAIPPAAGAPQLWAMPTFAVPGPCPPQPQNNAVTEPDEEDEDDFDDPDFWENNEIWDADE